MPNNSILIVDDTPINVKFLQFFLTANGYDVRTAANAEVVRPLLEQFKPRIILMDLLLPGMDGLELTRLLKADPQTADIVILAVTALAMRGDDEKALAAGCDGYVTKPIDRKALLLLLQKHMGS